MKKLLLSSAAICGLAMVATPAAAQVSLDVGGYFKGYGVYTDQDDAPAAGEARELDIIRDTEIHLSGETTLENGLTVGFHTEMEADQADSFAVQESYAYFSGGWGRVNFGAEDGAAYLLQVAAPSADNNYDGIRQFVSPINYTTAGSAALGTVAAGGIDYDQDNTGFSDKLTYLSPVMNGFQAGVSYTPEVTDAFDIDTVTDSAGSNSFGVNTDDVDDEYGQAFEGALRYEGQFNNVGVILGGGYTHIELENDGTPSAGAEDDQTVWNAGIDLDIGPFGIGAIYTENDFGDFVGAANDDEETIVVGVDYTTGPFKLGASYLDQDNTGNIAGFNGVGTGVETQRYTGGVVYNYGPGMSFRGSVSYTEHDNVAIAGSATEREIEATSVMLGTQINF